MPASLYYLALLLLPGLQNGVAEPAASQCRLSLRERTSFRGAKGDFTWQALVTRCAQKNVPEVRGADRCFGAATSDSSALAAISPHQDQLFTKSAPGPVRQALREGRFPWYDSGADRVRPVWAPRMSWLKWLRQRLDRVLDAIGRFFKSLGLSRMPSIGVRTDWLGTILLSTVLATFFVFLLALWLRREPFAAAASAARARPGSAELLGEFPGEFLAGHGDPWAEAQRRRLAGDLAGAVIYLFAHQLRSLDRLGLIRLAPGWTGRQYVRWLRDPVLVDSLAATLCLFEEFYYGHRLPSRDEFEHVWSRALALEERTNALEGSR